MNENNIDPIRIFISYCHANDIWLSEWEDKARTVPNSRCLLVQWERAFRKKGVLFWYDREDDNGLHGGDIWRKRIFEEIEKADISILLITHDFALSPFIMDEELPRIVQRFNRNELHILPILVEPTRLKDLSGIDLLKWQWTPGTSVSLDEIYERSRSDFNKAKIQVLNELELFVDEVRKRNDAEAKMETGQCKTPPEKRESRHVATESGVEERRNDTASPVAALPKVKSGIGRLPDRKRVLLGAGIGVVVVVIILFSLIMHRKPGGDSPNPREQESTVSIQPPSTTTIPSLPSTSDTNKSAPPGMKWIEGGTFMMGLEGAYADKDVPLREVMLDGFFMDTTEVTQEEYMRVMKINPSKFRDCPDCPVEQVSWYDAVLYCNVRTKADGSTDTVYSYKSMKGKLGNNCLLEGIHIETTKQGFRLPTEAEWEYACRAKSKTKYFWGDEMNGVHAWYKNNSGGRTHTVGGTICNDWRLYDLTGNVLEWCGDWFDSSYYYDRSKVVNPQGSMKGEKKILRGGSWKLDERDLVSSAHRYNFPKFRNDDVGFRCVRSKYEKFDKNRLNSKNEKNPIVSLLEKANEKAVSSDSNNNNGNKEKVIEAKVSAANNSPLVTTPIEEPKLGTEGMVWIEGGTFMMGSEDGFAHDEVPLREVTINGFYMDTTEVTQREYKRVMKINPSKFKDCPECPVEQVSWYDAVLYCNARTGVDGSNDTVYSYKFIKGKPGKDCILEGISISTSKKGFRLSTEAEWEYACRAGGRTRYFWGDEINREYVWFNDNSGNRTHNIGLTRPNNWHLYDMTGNVFEWCGDWFDTSYYYNNSQAVNPQGPEAGDGRVLRGGSWQFDKRYLRSAAHLSNFPEYRSDNVGFRCVRSR